LKIVLDLWLVDFGYWVILFDFVYVLLIEEGLIFFFNEVENMVKLIVRYLKYDVENYLKFEVLMDWVVWFVKLMMLCEFLVLGFRVLGDFVGFVCEVVCMVGFSKCDIYELVCVFMMFVGDFFDDYFEFDGFKGLIVFSGVVGVWVGLWILGIVYNLFYYVFGECGGIEGVWG